MALHLRPPPGSRSFFPLTQHSMNLSAMTTNLPLQRWRGFPALHMHAVRLLLVGLLWLAFHLQTKLLAVSEEKTSYFIAPAESADGVGTEGNPFPTVDIALKKVGGGHVFVLQPGIYRGPIKVPLQCKGTLEHPTVLKSAERWKAVLIGSEGHVFSSADGCEH